MKYLEDYSKEKEEELFIFTLNGKLYSILPNRILEIIKFIELEIPEKLPKDVAGIIKYGSYFINVVDLKSLFNIETTPYTPDNKILIVCLEDSIFAIIVDEIIGNKKIDINSIKLSPYKNENSFSEAFFSFENSIVTTLDLNAVDNKVRTSIAQEIEESKTNNLYPTDSETLALLKTRKDEYLNKESLEELVHCYNDKDAIIFEINGNKYCTEISDVQYFYKLNQNDKITKIPNVQSFMMGLLNIKGEFVPIIDLEKFINSGKTEVKNGSIVMILETQDYNVGILADKIGESINLEEEIEKFETERGQEGRIEFLNFVKDEEVYTIIKPKELFRAEKLQIN